MSPVIRIHVPTEPEGCNLDPPTKIEDGNLPYNVPNPRRKGDSSLN